jgi:hypothetical protein
MFAVITCHDDTRWIFWSKLQKGQPKRLFSLWSITLVVNFVFYFAFMVVRKGVVALAKLFQVVDYMPESLQH